MKKLGEELQDLWSRIQSEGRIVKVKRPGMEETVYEFVTPMMYSFDANWCLMLNTYQDRVFLFNDLITEFCLTDPTIHSYYPDKRVKRVYEKKDRNYSYGERWVEYLNIIEKKLKTEENSRQAIIMIRQADDINFSTTPCIISFQYFLREGKLDLVSNYRSQDLKIAPYDAVMSSILLQIMAKKVGAVAGMCYQVVNNLHCYEKDMGKQVLDPATYPFVMTNIGFLKNIEEATRQNGLLIGAPTGAYKIALDTYKAYWEGKK